MKLSHTTKVLKKNKKYSDKKVSKVLHVITRACGTIYRQPNSSADFVRADREGQWIG
jgi:hypothetical protein